jgi:hypothetical protein
MLKTNKKIIVSTWCTDDWQEGFGIDPLKKTFKYFHPDIDFEVVGTQKTEDILNNFSYIKEIMYDEDMPWFRRGKIAHWIQAPSVYHLKDEYDMIVHIDADSVVLGDLSDIFESDEDVISVKNTTPIGTWGCNPASDRINPFADSSFSKIIDKHDMVNVGMWAVNNIFFIDDWINLNKTVLTNPRVPIPYRLVEGMGDENDTFSWLFSSGKYRTKMIDRNPCDSGYYGCSVSWGTETHWDNWKSFYVKDKKVYFMDPTTNKETQIKLLHLGGGGADIKVKTPFMKMLKERLSSEVFEFIEEIVKND